jgi:hypothetical protein
MKLRYIAFKWQVDAPINAVSPVLEQVGLRRGKKHIWTRSVGDHSLHAEYREKMSSSDRSYFWIRFSHSSAPIDKGALVRVLADWFFTMSRHFTTCVNWMQVALDVDEFHSLYGYTENSPKIWIKTEQHLRYSFFPYLDHFLFEVRYDDIRKAIQFHRFSQWLDELKHNLLGHDRPDDQIRFDLVV